MSRAKLRYALIVLYTIVWAISVLVLVKVSVFPGLAGIGISLAGVAVQFRSLTGRLFK